jgi:FkbM family methyltransferase
MTVQQASIRDQSYWFDSGGRLEEFYSFLYAEKRIRDELFYPKAGDVFIDVGSSGGSWTIPACMLGATVYAFEPNQIMRSILTQNLRINGCNSVFIIDQAVSNEPGSACFHDNLPLLKHSYTSYSCTIPNTNVTSIDWFMNENGIMSQGIDWLKIDAEGDEAKVIQGAREAIRIYKPRIFVENHLDKHPYIEQEILNLVKSIRLDYDFKYIPLAKVNPVKAHFFNTPYLFFF